jgi:hypothetical protein
MKQIIWSLALGFVLWASPSFAGPTGAVLCYALANNAAAPLNMPYTPDSRSAFNAKGGAISVTHTGTGTYSVTCNGLGVGGIGFETVGNVQVTAVGDTNVYCHVNSWGAGILLALANATPAVIRPGPITFIDEFSATVVCFGRGGGGGGGPAPADSEFALTFIF